MAGDAESKVVLLPSPWDEPFATFDAFLFESDQALKLMGSGADLLSRFPAMFKPAALRQVERGILKPEAADSQIVHVENTATQARQLIQKEFAILRALILVGLWGALEALVFNVVVNHLTHREGMLNSEKLSKVRVVLALIEETNKDVRMTHVAQELVQQLRIGLSSGASRFETLLDVVDLSGPPPISDELRKGLFEVSQARNLIVHRTSVVARKFRDSCPWLNTQIGTRFVVTKALYLAYCSAIAEYASLLYERVRQAVS